LYSLLLIFPHFVRGTETKDPKEKSFIG